MLKRGISGEIKKLLMCRNAILNNGNQQVMLCERGIRTTRAATATPSASTPCCCKTGPPARRGGSSTGQRDLVGPTALQPSAGILRFWKSTRIWTGPRATALAENLRLEQFAELMGQILRLIAGAVGRSMRLAGGGSEHELKEAVLAA